MGQAGRRLLPSLPCTLTPPLDHCSLLGREAQMGSPCQLSVPRSAGRKIFPTASADSSSTNLSKGDLAEMPTSKLRLRNRLRFPRPIQTPASSAAADTESAHAGRLTLWRLLCTLMCSPASAFQPPGPQPKGTDLAVLSLSCFNRDRPGLALIL